MGIRMGMRVEVTYNSYLDGVEVGDLSCGAFDSFVDFCEHVATVKNYIPKQLKHDPQYRDIHEARMSVFVNGQRVAVVNFRRAAHDTSLINVSMGGSLITL